jgi:site-specific recombinase XerD
MEKKNQAVVGTAYILNQVKKASYSVNTKNIIQEYAMKLQAEGKSFNTISLYVRSLHYLGEYANKRDILKLDLDKDIHLFRLWLQKNKGTGITSQFHHLNDIRGFYLRHLDEVLVKKKLKFINSIKKEMTPRLTADQYSTYEDILNIIEAARTTRNKALIYFGWESGLRAGSLIKTKYRDLEKIDYDGKDVFQINIRQQDIKGKKAQCVPTPVLIQCVPHLMDWINEHQFKDLPDAPLFYAKVVNGVPQEMNSKSLNNMLKRTAKEIGFKKRIFWHALRHSHTKYLLSEGYPQGVVKAWHGLSEDSKMLNVYSKWDKFDVLNAAVSKQGLVKHKEETVIRKAKTCPRCKHNNTFDSKYCVKCWYVLDPKEAMDMRSNGLLTNEIQKMVNQAVQVELEKMKN